MSILEDIQKIRTDHVGNAILGFVAIVSPGVLCLYLFKPTLIYQFDVFKLLLISSALTMPLLTFNIFALAIIRRFEKGGNWRDSINILGAMLLNSLVFHSALLHAYFWEYHAFKDFVLWLFLVNAMLLLLSSFDAHRKKLLKEPSKNASTERAEGTE